MERQNPYWLEGGDDEYRYVRADRIHDYSKLCESGPEAQKFLRELLTGLKDIVDPAAVQLARRQMGEATGCGEAHVQVGDDDMHVYMYYGLALTMYSREQADIKQRYTFIAECQQKNQALFASSYRLTEYWNGQAALEADHRYNEEDHLPRIQIASASSSDDALWVDLEYFYEDLDAFSEQMQGVAYDS
jgi:hypothetical protein